MPNIESLSFELILNNEQFNEKVKQVKEAASGLNTDISNILESIKKIGSGSSTPKKGAMLETLRDEIKKTEKELANLENKYTLLYRNARKEDNGVFIANKNIDNKFRDLTNEAEALRKKLNELREAYAKIGGGSTSAAFDGYIKSLTDTNVELIQMRKYYQELEGSTNTVRTHTKLWRELGGLAASYFSIQGASRLLTNLVNITAEFEKQRIALRAILQDADKADDMFEQIKELAVQSPFSFKELVTYTKQLSAYSIPIEELYDTTKMLADVSAGLGVGMDRIILAYSQIRSASFLRGQEVRQLTEAGIPILTELAKQIEQMEGHAISVSQVFDRISSRQITFEMVEKVFKDMTSEGGKFYKMQEVLADTLSGKLSNLTDAYQIMLSNIGDKNKGFMVSAVDLARSLAENYERVGKILGELVVTFGVYKTAVLAAEIATKTFDLTNHKMIKNLVDGLKALKVFMASNPITALVLGVTALAAGIIKLATAQTESERKWKEFDKQLANTKLKVDEEVAEFEKLYVKLKLAKEGTEEYAEAKNVIESKYGTYISQLKAEGKEVGNLIGLYDDLKKAISDSATERYQSNALRTAEEAFEASKEEVEKSFNAMFGGNYKGPNKTVNKATETAKQVIWRWIIGATSREEAEQYVSKAWLDMANFMRVNYMAAENEYNKKTADIINTKAKLDAAFSDDKAISVFAQKVQDALAEMDITEANKNAAKGWWADQYTDEYDYLEKIRKRRAEILEQLQDTASYETESKKALNEELNIINAIFKKTEKSPIAPANVPWQAKNETGKSAEQTYWETQRDTLKDIMSWYDKFKEAGMQNGDIQDLLKKFFPDHSDTIEALNFRDALLKVADALEEYDKKAAQALRDDVSGNNLQQAYTEWKKAVKAAEDYEKLQDDIKESFAYGGEGSEFNISKIISDYKKNITDIMKRRKDLRKRLYESEAKDIDYEGMEEQIDDSTFTSMRNALAKANEDVRKQAEAWVKNWEGFEGIDLSRMSELTINELKNLRSQLDVLKDNPLADFPKELKSQLTESGISIDTFADAVKKAIDELDKKTKEQERKAVVEKLKSYADGFKKVADGVKSLGEATNNTDLTDLAEQMGDIADTAVKMADAWADGNIAGVVVTAASYVANAWLEAIAGAERFKATIQDLSLEMLELRYQSQLASGTDTIFGDNTYRSLKNASDTIGQLQSKMDGLQSKLDGITISTKKSKWWEFFLAPTASAAWAKLFTNKSFSVTEALQQMGTDLMLENGKVNVDALQKLIDAYDGFSKAEKEAMEDAIKEAQAYNDALDQLDTAMESLTGNVAGDFASAIVEQWKSAGDAAADYSKILDGLATQYAEMMIKNALLENIFDDDFKKQITDLTVAKNATGVLDLFDSKVKQLEEYYPTFEEILNGLDQYFVKDTEGSEASTLSNGIKSITEDTANLLASYVNAIRADVAYNRMQLEQILGLLPSSPTLADYLMQIQANTYNTAENTRVLMENINSVMTTSDGPALRVFM